MFPRKIKNMFESICSHIPKTLVLALFYYDSSLCVLVYMSLCADRVKYVSIYDQHIIYAYVYIHIIYVYFLYVSIYRQIYTNISPWTTMHLQLCSIT